MMTRGSGNDGAGGWRRMVGMMAPGWWRGGIMVHGKMACGRRIDGAWDGGVGDDGAVP